jgi:hypothetical protein
MRFHFRIAFPIELLINGLSSGLIITTVFVSMCLSHASFKIERKLHYMKMYKMGKEQAKKVYRVLIIDKQYLPNW